MFDMDNKLNPIKFLQEVEREISFRTENGLYYSYFKHLVKAPSLWEGYNQLKEDDLTEHGSNINIFGKYLSYKKSPYFHCIHTLFFGREV